MNAAKAVTELALENVTELIDVRTYMNPGYPETMGVPVRPV